MRKYIQACNDALQRGHIKEEIIKGHINHHVAIDKYIPDASSFFYVVQFPMGKYHFLGKQQEQVSGYALDMKPIIDDIISDGKASLRAIARELNARGFVTRQKKEWTANSVRLCMARYGKKE